VDSVEVPVGTSHSASQESFSFLSPDSMRTIGCSSMAVAQDAKPREKKCMRQRPEVLLVIVDSFDPERCSKRPLRQIASRIDPFVCAPRPTSCHPASRDDPAHPHPYATVAHPHSNEMGRWRQRSKSSSIGPRWTEFSERDTAGEGAL
jgi:hypothetical protein